MARIVYRPEIDGLRAFAVVPVVLFHMGMDWVPGGFLGVDVFFVISGFLITSILKREIELGSFSFCDFWARRVRRILPPMLVVFASTLAVTYAFVFRPDQQVIGKQGLAAIFPVANIYFWRTTGDYWGTASETSPFLHSWSLSVEEQFYLFFPVAMWLVYRFKPRWLQIAIAAAVVGSFAIFLWGLEAHPTATFYLLPTRVWELGSGSLLAVTLRAQLARTKGHDVLAIVGLGMILVSYFYNDMLNAGASVVVVGAALIIAFGQVGLSGRILSRPSVVHIGKISYSLYLWHWPVIVLAPQLGIDRRDFLNEAFLVSMIYTLALGTYHFVEKPSRRRIGVVPITLISWIFVAGAALGIAWTPRYYDTSQFNEPIRIVYDCHPTAYDGCRPVWGTSKLIRPGFKRDCYSKGGICVGDGSVVPEVVVLGDSHGSMWSEAIASVVKQENIPTRFYCMTAVSPFSEIPPKGKRFTWNLGISKQQLLEFDEARLRDIAKWKPKVVIISQRWSIRGESAETNAWLKFLSEQGSTVLLIEDPPVLASGNVNVMQLLAKKGTVPLDGTAHTEPYFAERPDEGGRKIVRDLAASFTHVNFVPAYDLFETNEGAMVTDGRDVLYLDDDHLLTAGARKIVPRLRSALLKIFECGSGDDPNSSLSTLLPPGESGAYDHRHNDRTEQGYCCWLVGILGS